MVPKLSNTISRGRVGVALIALIVALVVGLSGGRDAATAAELAARAARTPNPPTDQLILIFEASAGPALSAGSINRQIDRLSEAAGMRLTFVRPMSGGAFVFRLPARLPETEVAAIAGDLEGLPEVAYAAPDIVLRHTGSVPDRAAVGAASWSVAEPRAGDQMPDDPSFDDQWHYGYSPGTMEGLNLLPAWDITTGSNTIVVAVLDTGILPHADLAGRTVPGYDFITSPARANDNDHQSQNNSRDANPADPGDWYEANGCGPGSGAAPSTWHGTHVAGTIGAASDNGAGVAGVDWTAKILPVRVLGRCGGNISDIVDAIRWSAGLAVGGVPPNATPARVINMSLGGAGICGSNVDLQLLQQAINDATAAGAVVVVSAGNDFWIADFYSPASCDNVITVAAGTRLGDLAYYSNYGSTVEVTAPGGENDLVESDGVLSTLNSGMTGPAADSLAFYQGTSMATPHVAGLASLILSLDPSLTPSQVTELIQVTARDFPAGSNCTDAACGEGLADAYAALKALDSGLLPPDLVAPANGAILNTATPLLKWSAVNGADGYGLVIGDDALFTSGPLDTTVQDTSFTLLDPLPDGTYYWRVNANAGSDFSIWSAVRTFTIDTAIDECDTPGKIALSAPADESHFVYSPIEFDWLGDNFATVYDFRIDDDQNFDSPFIEETVTTNGTTLMDQLGVGPYYWSVRGRNTTEGCDEAGEWSDGWSFVIDEDMCVVPATPVLLVPADGAVTDDPTPNFSWSAAANTNQYEILIDDDPSLANPTIEIIPGTLFTLTTALDPGVYYWSVRGWNFDEGVCSVYGPLADVSSFTIEAKTEYDLFLPAVIR